MQAKVDSSRRFIVWGSACFLVVAVVMFAATHFLVEIWWHDSLNMLLYYLLRIAYRDLIALTITLIQGSFIFLNFILVPQLLGFEPKQLFAGSGFKNRLSVLMLTPSARLFMLSAAIFTIPILTPIYLHWEDFLLYFFNSGSDMKDPVFERDISFYLFTFPLFKLVQYELLAVFSLLFATIALVYWVAYRQLDSGKRPLPPSAQLHLSLLILVIVAIQAWSIALERFDILYVDRHKPVYFGPGFVELNFQLPLIWLSFLFFIAAAIAGIWYIHTRRGLKLMFVCASIYFATVAIKQGEWVPGLIERFYVVPNPVTAERKNIDYNIQATLQAFELDRVERIDYPLKSASDPINSQAINKVLKNIPLWDHDLLLAGYDQMQAIRTFFDFDRVAVDRYWIEGRNYQVNVAARELNIYRLPQEAKTWNNLHFIYTHGYGVVMTPSLQTGNQPMQWLIRDLNMQTDYEQLKIKRPQIFYGLAKYYYAITPNDARAPQPEDENLQIRNDLQVEGGVAISSLFRRIVLSSYLQDIDLLVTTNLNAESRLLFRRNILEMLETLAPFLTIDPNPYPVVVDGKIYWIVDAYTASNQYPLVDNYNFPIREQASNGAVHRVNYLRNSVKIIIDAYSGQLDFYLIDPKDPVAMTYRNIYPMLFKDADDIPPAFINHLSYPSRLLALQMDVYSRYHQTNPDVYYQQSEAMSFPEVEEKRLLPYFLTLAPSGGLGNANPDLYRFLLLAPLTKINRDNLGIIAMAGCIKAADCRSSYSADIAVYRFSFDQQVEGPAQINSFINQDPIISQQLTLWQQRGTKVIKGRMIIVPVDGNLLYIQPIYTQSTRTTGFPQLTRIIVAMNQVAAMDASIEGAFQKLKAKLGL
ncbi:UPF0182 family protein [Methylomarinum sp. Ch1-1]|uniref:UPF0182 family protein n=1 Tax=Methylomarinum roseum TaxID=3067653 RepID=A0AAU7NZ64_9GAMM|nr:UPF0182 family protein [Methylomarinum sp. Ch1-1]MDP4521593.1 UPF0182 family protein [Methylomarinum sp. Ch1-1]